jgi:deoxycytidine triphosphate deaminase
VVLADLSLWKLLNDLVRDPDPDLVGPASIDVRVGPEMLREVGPGELQAVDLTAGPVDLAPGEFALVRTVEWLMVPNGYAVELKLKSSRAHQGFDSAMGLWLDPGWCGAPTLAVRNTTRFTPLPLECGMRIGQLVVHQLDQPAVRPHDGRSHDARPAGSWASAAERSLR